MRFLKAGKEVKMSNHEMKPGAAATVLMIQTKHQVGNRLNVAYPFLVQPKLCLG